MSIAGYKIRNQNGIHFISFAVVEWIDVFTRPNYAKIVVDSLNYSIKNKGLVVYSWCIMSNHVHLIIRAREGYQLSDILRDFKKYTARQIVQAIENDSKESRRKWMLWMFRSAGNRNNRNQNFQFWRQDNQPKELVSNNFMDQKLQYIHDNPVLAGMVRAPEHYQWSSAIDYAGVKGLVEVEFMG